MRFVTGWRWSSSSRQGDNDVPAGASRIERASAAISASRRFGDKTIRGQILLAFLAMSLITASLGYFAARGLEHVGELADRTFDRSLMSVNFARAAAADFSALEAAAARRAFAADDESRARLDSRLAALASEMDDDLSIAVERAQSARAVDVAKKVQTAVAIWKTAAAEIRTAPPSKLAWAQFDRQASIVAQELDLLVNYTAGDGFSYRQSARATTQRERRFNLGATILALAVSGVIAFALSRRVVLPIEKASEIAQKIAEGDLDVAVPAGNADELGRLLAAMDAMRDNIKSSMAREVDMRLSAQNRLADALEGSREGIVIADADGTIVLANAQASHLLGLLDADNQPLVPGDPATRLNSAIGCDDADFQEAKDMSLASGQWLRISSSPTQEGGRIFVLSDISVECEQQAALSTANLWLDAALANLSHGVCLFGPDNTLKVYNRRYCELFGLPVDRVRPGMSLRELIDVACGGGLVDESASALRTRLEARIADRKNIQHLHKRSDGRCISVSHRPLQDLSWLSTYEDVTDRMEAAEKIVHMACHDALTGLPNRSFFAERIESALKAAEHGQSFSLLCLDLDHFKEVNDTLGHPVGDDLLRAVAGRLRATTRETDMVARLGGDEFAIVQAVESEEDARVLASRIISALNVPFEVAGHPVRIGVSIGISHAPRDGNSYDALLKNADLALYRAKADGRNSWRFFEPVMDERQQTRRLIELDLREAIDRDQFELDYQPIIELGADRITAFEALLRWRHPVRGLLPPADFVPIAEELGLIAPIGDMALRRACRDAMRWPSDISVSVNVSAAQLRHGGLDGAVLAALNDSGLPANRLVLEITESVLIANAQKARLVLDRCKGMGIKIAMDDFGTGYSSLSYLRSFPFDDVKIDKSFIGDVALRPDAAAIVRAIVSLCASLGMRTVAEGVERPEQLAFLRAEGCHAAQGFLFSKPVPARAVSRLIRSRRRLDGTDGATKAA